ncbi:uncharacterized protein N7482_007128 [Penicillium canariense]|uniref:Uncharacterized protein n=1 Tax=Penicillium canariense TaxID=189055 RepID=A0A9W9HW63_9EURO|nr:uncharacterized protein N7482_007128 [Penicillium canariense]KAJ5160124.1 hypothetical protein N7482_007128 [Penicillium canariense]
MVYTLPHPPSGLCRGSLGGPGSSTRSLAPHSFTPISPSGSITLARPWLCPTHTNPKPPNRSAASGRVFARICWTAGSPVRPWLQPVDRHLSSLLQAPASLTTAVPLFSLPILERDPAGLDAVDFVVDGPSYYPVPEARSWT